ncbi:MULTISPECIES: hypothetical protein [unclassified Flavobacterium]|jgi:hypothetical protein|uniref:hypothetical protein n=1 Tax=unclassified Flavobacterium TaxID=196869 RepID=UPI0025B8EEB1|nr:MULTISPECIES: hypothetical protein [unclassified Flavobacterium]
MKKNDSAIISKTVEKCTTKPINNKWDKLLCDYNNYVKEYISHYKKSLKGKLVSLSKYPYMRAKSEILYERLDKAQNKALLTKKQIKRMSKIQMKIVNACCS